MSNPWAQSFEELRSPYLQEKMAKKDYDGDGKIETGTQEYMGSRDKAIKKAMGKKVEGKKKVAEHHQKDANGNVIEHDENPRPEEEIADDLAPSSVEEAKIDKIDPKNKRNRRNVAKFGKQTKPYDPPTKEMKTSMGKFMQKTRQDMHKSKRGVKKEEVVLEADKKGKGSGTKDACYHKVKSRYSVWPSAYASGALVKCRKAGAKNWGNSSKKEEFDYYQMPMKSFGDMVGECWKTHKQVGTKMKGGKVVPNCVPKNEEVAVEDHVKLSGSAQKEYDKLVNIVKDKNLPMDKRQGADAALTQGGHSSVLQTMLKDKKIKEAVKPPKLDVKETGVKNKIEVNPEIKTEEAKASAKK